VQRKRASEKERERERVSGEGLPPRRLERAKLKPKRREEK